MKISQTGGPRAMAKMQEDWLNAPKKPGFWRNPQAIVASLSILEYPKKTQTIGHVFALAAPFWGGPLILNDSHMLSWMEYSTKGVVCCWYR